MSLSRGAGLFFLLFLLFFALDSGKIAAENIIEEREGSGVYVNTHPKEAKLYIDGIFRGRTPLFVAEIMSGSHNIRIEKDFYEDWQAEINVSGRGMLYIERDLALSDGEPVRRAEDNAVLLRQKNGVESAKGAGDAGGENNADGVNGAGGAGKNAGASPAEPDSKNDFYPLSLYAARSGLFYAESASTLPKRSIQVESSFYASLLSPAFLFAFDLGLRFSPARALEAAAQFSMDFSPSEHTDFGVAFSVKKEFYGGGAWGGFAPEIAGALYYSWTNNEKEGAAGFEPLLGVSGAFNFKLPRGFTVLFSPAFFWFCKGGYPRELKAEFEFGAGLLWEYSFFAIGASSKVDIIIEGENGVKTTPKPAAALEAIFTPGNTALFLALRGAYNFYEARLICSFSAGFSR